MTVDEGSIGAWTLLWRTGITSSFAPAGDTEAGRALRDRWRALFAECPDGARILDVGTGNGAVAAEAVSVAEDCGRSFSVQAIDQALIDPVGDARHQNPLLARVIFHGGIRMESLPFGDGNFDCTSSQFALEYSRTELSIPEILRVLRSEGRFLFLMHSKGSRIQERCRVQAHQVDLILQSPLFERLRHLLVQIARTPPDGPLPNSLIAAIEAVRKAFASLDRTVGDETDRSLVDAFIVAARGLPTANDARSLDERLLELDHLKQRVEAQRRRFQDLEAACQGEEDIVRVTSLLHAAGAEDVEAVACVAGGEAVGWWISGRKGV